MARSPALDEFRHRVQALQTHPVLGAVRDGDTVRLAQLSKEQVLGLIRDEDQAGYYFLMAAARLSRTSLKKAAETPEARIVRKELRKAYALQRALPVEASFSAVAEKAISQRSRDLSRRERGAVEGLLRERLRDEGIPLAMSPPLRIVPGLLIASRKPDGVYPDPSTGLAPQVLLEIKGIRRVSDDIQKRLYEIAETSLEMKAIYGRLELSGFGLEQTAGVAGDGTLRSKLREQITSSRPVVVAFFVCPRAEAERYREGAEAFIDRVFFQEEVEDCIQFLREAIESAPSSSELE